MYIYDESFYSNFENESRKIANIIMPCVIEQVKPKSIVDFGCGEGMWLSVAKNIDKSIEILGLDGSYVKRERLKIPEECFRTVDLEKGIKLACKYDLAMSLEVAEHLNEKNSDLFVESLTCSSDNILFSAAIPGQGGRNHINEQWQSYWVDKFEEKGYFADISLRKYFWDEEGITPWRRQNILFFSKRGKNLLDTKKEIYDIVHPKMFEKAIQRSGNKGEVKERYCKIDEKIKELINDGTDKFIIYPFGENGFLCKEILNNKYHIKEVAIVDNKLCKENKDILPASAVSEVKENYCVIENSSNYELHKELLKEIKKYIDEEKIVSVFDF